jgi:hypothetical protein
MVNHSGLTMYHSVLCKYLIFKELAVLDLPYFTNVEKKPLDKRLKKRILNGKTCNNGSYFSLLK